MYIHQYRNNILYSVQIGVRRGIFFHLRGQSSIGNKIFDVGSDRIEGWTQGD